MRRSSLTLLFALSFGACAPHAQPVATPTIVAHDQAIDRAKLRDALEQRRKTSVVRFLAYREARVYPQNTYVDGPRHVWLDAQGHLCAAATIISGDWGRAATENVAAENNFIALADVHDGPLYDWILTSGLTHSEIVAIQVEPIGDEPPEQPAPSPVVPAPDDTQRLYTIYVDVERQLTQMWNEDLDAATDALMKRPELARRVLDGLAAAPGRFATKLAQPA